MKIYLLGQLPLVAAAWLPSLAPHTASAAQTPKAGDAAPLIEGKDQDGKTWKLADVLGKKLVLLYFYPKDDTPGCTKEACGFRDRMADLQKDNIAVIGVSFDSGESHQKFIAKYKLNFPLLADAQRVCMKGIQSAGRWWVTKFKALERLSSPIAAWKSVSDWKWGLGWRPRHSMKRLMTNRRNMPRIHSPLVLRTLHRSSLSDTSKRWWVPFSIPQPCRLAWSHRSGVSSWGVRSVIRPTVSSLRPRCWRVT